MTLSFSLPLLIRDYITNNHALIIFLLFGNDFEALLDVDSEVDDDLVGGPTHLVILEEDVRSELSDSLIYNVITLSVGLRCWSLDLGLNWQDCKSASSGIFGFIIK